MVVRSIVLASAFVSALALASSVAVAQPKAPGPASPAAPAAQAAKTGPGTQSVRAANDTIAGLLKQKVAAGSKEEKDLAAKVTTSVRSFLDIDQLGKRAMVDNWSKLSKAQQDQFVGLLRELIEDNYVRGLRANLDYQVDYTGESTDAEGNVVVTTKINTKRRGRPYAIEVDYVLVKDGDKLRAWDVKTDGVGLVENYRTMFDKIIDKDGFDGLIAKMKKKQAASGS
ncbi:MAG TPA: ABC transporter substrate-binding protein [Kofleriaceae bacterium]|jgi:ABC-type transporter MlaC component|nr:ABC transporter substrate-binding protein [Kofleriaceae bacterium]